MIRKFCEWYLRKFPKKLPEGRYPANEPWQVAVTINTDSGREVKYIDYQEDRLMYHMGSADWDNARYFALRKLDYIKEHGYTERIEGMEVFYPLHRVHLVQAYAKPKSELTTGVDVDHHNV